VIDVLKSGHTRGVDFSFTGSTGGNVKITPNDILRVAQAIEQDNIAVVEGGVPDGMAKYTAANDGAAREPLSPGARTSTGRMPVFI